jgi:predicted lipid-binding transport protein (Tim44 family)
MGGLLARLLEIIGLIVVSIFRFATERSSDGQRTWVFQDPAQVDPGFVPTAQVWTTAPPQSIQQRVHDEVTALQQIDPDFNELQFLSQAAGIYQTYLSCDADMNADGMTSIATPQCVAAYRTCVAKWKNAGVRRVVHDMKIVGSATIKVMLDGTRQAIVVRFISSGVRFTQDSDSGVATDGSARSDSFTEFATFVRPAGTSTTKSAAAGGTTHCPSCGAPVTAGAATCAFCGTNIPGTGGTWLMDKISESAYT